MSSQTTLSYESLKQISDSVGTRVGWDFSHIRTKMAPVAWDHTNVVCQYLTQTDTVLDVGTGGGKFPYTGRVFLQRHRHRYQLRYGKPYYNAFSAAATLPAQHGTYPKRLASSQEADHHCIGQSFAAVHFDGKKPAL